MSDDISLNPNADVLIIYDTILPAALALDLRLVEAARGNPLTLYQNVKASAQTVLAHEDEIARALPLVDLAIIKTLPDSVLALKFAVEQVKGQPQSGALPQLLPRVFALRGTLLTSAIALAKAGLFPAAEVKAIQKGKGKIDASSDAVQLSALFVAHADLIRGKHPVSEDDIKEAGRVGSQALALLRPKNAHKAMTAKVDAAVDIRNRIYSLIVKRYYDHVWRAGAWVFGPDVDAYIRPLHSQRRARIASESTEAAGQPTATHPAAVPK